MLRVETCLESLPRARFWVLLKISVLGATLALIAATTAPIRGTPTVTPEVRDSEQEKTA